MRYRGIIGGSILFSFLTTGAAMADLFGKSALSSEWVERFRDVSKLNAFAAIHPVHLSGVVLIGWDISGAKLPGARFEGTEWKDVRLERGLLSNVTFRKSKLQGVNFDQSVLTDVTFEDVELRSTSFFKAKLQRVRFVRCKFNGVSVDETVDSAIEIIDSKLLSSSLSEGQLIAVIQKSTLKDVEFTDLQPPSSLTFEKSELTDVDLSRSILEQMTLKDVTSSKSGIRNGRVDRFLIEGGNVAFGLSESVIRSLVVHGSKIQALSMDDNTIEEFILADCAATNNIGLYRAKVKNISVDRCKLNDFRLRKAIIERWTLRDSTLSNSKFEMMKARDVTFENVELEGLLNFTGANIEHFVKKNITKKVGLTLSTDESNIVIE